MVAERWHTTRALGFACKQVNNDNNARRDGPDYALAKSCFHSAGVGEAYKVNTATGARNTCIDTLYQPLTE